MLGKKFGLLTVTGPAPSNRGRHWFCQCECGNEVIRATGQLNRASRLGQHSTCGAIGAHVYGNTPLFRIYWNMVNRCNCPSSSAYKNYGERGITVCAEWMDGYLAFHEWAMANNYEEWLSLEREDVNLGYSPRNCTWIPLEAQAWNKRNTRRLTWNGKTQSAVEWAKELGISFDALQLRITRGWSAERIFTQPYRAPR